MPIRKPRWSVTWPTRPSGLDTVWVRADDPTEAVRVASELELPLTDSYEIAFDYTPEVWRLARPYRWRAHRVAGPDYGGTADDAPPFVPEPLGTEAA